MTLSMVAAVAAVSLLSTAGARAQTSDQLGGGTESVELVPIECRWRADASAVRVGEPFTVVLTCAVVETASTTVAPDQSRLEPSVVDLQPFEVVGGRVGQDVRTPSYRHFQYAYDVRYLGELFGTDIPVPELTITYRVQSRLESGEVIEGRELQYALPPLALRILSLVPDEAADIRELPPATFAAADARRFRARAYDLSGLALLILAGVTAIWALVGVARRRTTRVVTTHLMPDTTVLLAAARHLDAVRRERNGERWSSALAARALAALRIAASVETSRLVAQVEADPLGHVGDGQLAVRAPWPSRRLVWVSGSATAATVASECARRDRVGERGTARLEELQRLVALTTTVAYAPDTEGAPEPEPLDAAVDAGEAILRTMAHEHLSVVRLARSVAESAAALGRRVWAR